MKRRTLAMVAVALLGVWSLGLLADNHKTPTVKEVMQKLHKGADSPLNKIKQELKADQPEWSRLQKQTKNFVILGAALAKNEPPRGSKASWQRLSVNYLHAAEALDNAVQKESQPDAKAAFAKISASCAACHRVHKGRG